MLKSVYMHASPPPVVFHDNFEIAFCARTADERTHISRTLHENYDGGAARRCARTLFVIINQILVADDKFGSARIRRMNRDVDISPVTQFGGFNATSWASLLRRSRITVRATHVCNCWSAPTPMKSGNLSRCRRRIRARARAIDVLCVYSISREQVLRALISKI